MSETRQYPWWTTPLAVVAAGGVRTLGASWRVHRVRTEAVDAGIKAGQGVIFAFWHARLLPLVYTHRQRSIVVLSGWHRDAELMVRVLRRFGFISARGSSSRGAGTGVREMLRQAKLRRPLAITPDGPRGPVEELKPGLVTMASHVGFPIVPVATAASTEWRLNSWDRFRVPKPFARVIVAYGDPIPVPPKIDEAEVPDWCARIAASITGLTAEADRLAQEGR